MLALYAVTDITGVKETGGLEGGLGMGGFGMDKMDFNYTY